MATERTLCRICDEAIPPARLKAMPETEVCVACSEKIGGEFQLEVKIGLTGKPGSLKKTGESIEVKRKPRNLR